jgi:hypothetical protein
MRSYFSSADPSSPARCVASASVVAATRGSGGGGGRGRGSRRRARQREREERDARRDPHARATHLRGRREDESAEYRKSMTRGATMNRILRNSRGERDAGAVSARPRAPPAPLRAARLVAAGAMHPAFAHARPAHETGGGQMPVPVRPRASRVAEIPSRPVPERFFPSQPPRADPDARPRAPTLTPAPRPPRPLRSPVPARTRTPALRRARPSTRAATRPPTTRGGPR